MGPTLPETQTCTNIKKAFKKYIDLKSVETSKDYYLVIMIFYFFQRGIEKCFFVNLDTGTDLDTYNEVTGCLSVFTERSR